MNLNQVWLIGRIGNDLELKYTPSGLEVTSFRLAVDRPLSSENRQAGQEKQTDWIDVVAWRGTAKFLCERLGKGCSISVVGRIQIRSYVAQDNSNRRVCEVVAETVNALTWPPKESAAA